MPASETRTIPYSFARLTLAGLLSGIISSLIAAPTLLALSNYEFFSRPHEGALAGSAVANFAEDFPSALLLACAWYVPTGTFLFPALAKLIGSISGEGMARLLKLMGLGAMTWFLIGKGLYVLLSPLAPPPPGAEQHDLLSAALSGVLFAVVYDLALRQLPRLIELLLAAPRRSAGQVPSKKSHVPSKVVVRPSFRVP